MGELATRSNHCLLGCMALPCCVSSVDRPEAEDRSQILAEYMEYGDVVSKTLSFQLPPHRECDCDTDLLEVDASLHAERNWTQTPALVKGELVTSKTGNTLLEGGTNDIALCYYSCIN